MADEADYVELVLTCADVCTALNQGLKGRPPGDLGHSVCEAITRLTT